MTQAPTWLVDAKGFDENLIARDGSNFLIGNGYLGVRGALESWRADRYPAITVSDTYDNADGRWQELCTVPNGLYAELRNAEGQELLGTTDTALLARSLDLETGTVRHTYTLDNGAFKIETERFASYDDLHLVAWRMKVTARDDVTLELRIGIDARCWSLNGNHFRTLEPVIEAPADPLSMLGFHAVTTERGTQVEVREGARVHLDGDATLQPLESEPILDDERLLRVLQLTLAAGSTIVIERAFSVATSNDRDPATDVHGLPAAAAVASVEKALEQGWTALSERQYRSWRDYWNLADVEIEGDDEAQRALRFSIYQNRIATPAHSDRLPVGARGLSCQAYQGAAFWDQETYNLDVFLHTQPHVARNFLRYRWHTLQGARNKARRLGYEGAYYAWISGDDGEELCPDWFFREVITGREIRNHFNDQQIHVSPDIAVTIREYLDATGDTQFLEEGGAEILFEVARFLASRVVWIEHRQRYEIHRVLGPDEYHEFVDDNAFTNHQARAALDVALEAREILPPTVLESLDATLGIDASTVSRWRDVARRLFLPQPDPETRVIEQFRDYFTLEDVRPQDLKERLLDPGEYWGWPIGVAVHTQVLKQADVLQLLIQDADTDRDVLEANYAYYEPRTQHGSSLSPSVHAIAAARLGRREDAYRYFMKSALVDLAGDFKAVSGGTFIGGIHTAACAGTWQAAVYGFGGLSVTPEGLVVRPLLPDGWKRLAFRAMHHGQRAAFSVTLDHVTVTADAGNDERIHVQLLGQHLELAAGDSMTLPIPDAHSSS